MAGEPATIVIFGGMNMTVGQVIGCGASIADLKFINNVNKPWDDLNHLLTYRYAVKPG